jgi:translocation and assembly module TamA
MRTLEYCRIMDCIRRRCRWRIVMIIWLAGVVGMGAGPAFGADSADNHSMAYEVVFEGLAMGDGLIADLKAVSLSLQFQEKPPYSLNQLRHRARQDIPRMQAVLRNAGHYQAHITSSVDDTAKPIKLRFTIEKGTQYKLNKVDIQIDSPSKSLSPKDFDGGSVGLLSGQPAAAKTILQASKRLTQIMQQKGFALARTKTPELTVDHRTHGVDVTLVASPGPPVHFGKTSITGLKEITEAVVRQKIAWENGARFDPQLIVKTQERLARSRLFSVVQVRPGVRPDGHNRLPITIDLREREHRSFSLGASFRTDEGFGGKAGWEHRNLFQSAQKLRFNTYFSEIGHGMEALFQRPSFLDDRLSLGLTLKWAEDRPEAYESRSAGSGISLTYTASDQLQGSIGLDLLFAEIDQLGINDTYSLLGMPFVVRWDSSDDVLDPQNGIRLKGTAAPYFDFEDRSFAFVRLEGDARWYTRVLKSPQTVLALKAGAGTIWGGSLSSVPPDFRFYGGGGGSVRGYGYQLLGPLQDNRPTGGRALVELGAELRVRVTKDVGLAVYLDAGNAYDEPHPDLQEKLLYYGAGIGFRYFTPIGPLRLDVALPLQRRDGIDDAFQYYISIGQAF